MVRKLCLVRRTEYDSVGEFLVGVYRHYQDTGDNTFLTTVWPAVQAAANFSNRMWHQWTRPRDNSIWEQTDQYNTFSEAFYVAGLRAAAHLALTKSNPTDADAWNGSASTILSAIQRSVQLGHPGRVQRHHRLLRPGRHVIGSPDTTIDASSDELIALGDVNANSEQAASQISVVQQALTHDTWGIARYEGDDYYYTSPYSPGGQTKPAR